MIWLVILLLAATMIAWFFVFGWVWDTWVAPWVLKAVQRWWP